MQKKPTYEELTQRIKALEESNKNYNIVFENTGTAITIIEEDTTISLVNSEFEALSGITKQEIEGRMNLAQFFSEKERDKIIEYHVLRRMDTPLVPRSFETEFLDNIGTIKPVYMAVSLIPHTNQSVASILDLTDITQTQQALTKQQAYFSQLFENSPQAIMIVDIDGKIIDVNESFEKIFGYAKENTIGRFGRHIIVPKDRIAENEALYKSALKGKSIHKETFAQHIDGKLVPVYVIAYPIKIENRIDGYFCIYNDISERKVFEKQLHHQAFYDSLTGMPNRLLFIDRLGRAVKRAKRHQDYSFSVLLIDLDRFKDVNDSLGHLAGDNLLVEIAHRFQSCVRSVDTIARLGGDEFAILTEEYSTPQEAIQIAKRIQNAAEKPFNIDNNEAHISASIGIVVNTKTYVDSESILRDADIAMYRAKAQGKACFRVFNKKMHELIVESRKIENDLRNAVQNREMKLHFQPIISIDAQKLKGFEALVRWNHPEQGLVFPDKFIPIAEETGLINPLGNWVFNEACRQLKEWQEAIPNCDDITMSINISVKQFMQKDLVELILEAVRKNNIDPTCLKVEFTENILMEPSKSVVEKFRCIKEIGIALVIDDFGTGYSSLSYLQQFPIDNLKIDRSFVKGLGVEKESMEIVKTIVDLGKNLGLTITAEGVETETQFEKLKSINCDDVQGFLFSEAVDSILAAELIKKYL